MSNFETSRYLLSGFIKAPSTSDRNVSEWKEVENFKSEYLYIKVGNEILKYSEIQFFNKVIFDSSSNTLYLLGIQEIDWDSTEKDYGGTLEIKYDSINGFYYVDFSNSVLSQKNYDYKFFLFVNGIQSFDFDVLFPSRKILVNDIDIKENDLVEIIWFY